MLYYDDVPFSVDLFNLETQYMPVSGYMPYSPFATPRTKAYDVIDSARKEAGLCPVECYAAMSYYDMFASRNNLPVIEECEDKSNEVFAAACVYLVGKLEDDDSFDERLLMAAWDWCLEIFDLTKSNMERIEAHMLQALDGRVHLITPMAFFNHLFPFLYVDEDTTETDDVPPPWLVLRVQGLIWAIHRNMTFTEYKPSIIMAAAMLASKPVEDYQQRLANCPIHMATLERCLATMRECLEARNYFFTR